MNETFTKSMARNIFFGGSLFFFLLLVGLSADTVQRLPERDNRENLTPQVVLGKKVWEDNNCIGCHTLLGEGAYFAPELGNVYVRYGNSKKQLKALLKAVLLMVFLGVAACLSSTCLKKSWKRLLQFLKYMSEIDTNDWPPNVQG